MIRASDTSGMFAALIVLTAGAATAQEASTCRAASAPEVVDARQTLERDPSALNPRLRLADTLIEVECYADAVQTLEAGEAMHPGNSTLEARLRSARSMISEQNYIASVTRAEEGARLERNLLRCRKLADVAACDEALTVRRNDADLLAARAAAVAQKGEPAVVAASQPAPPAVVEEIPPPRRPTVVAAVTPRPKPITYSNEAPASRSN